MRDLLGLRGLQRLRGLRGLRGRLKLRGLLGLLGLQRLRRLRGLLRLWGLQRLGCLLRLRNLLRLNRLRGLQGLLRLCRLRGRLKLCGLRGRLKLCGLRGRLELWGLLRLRGRLRSGRRGRGLGSRVLGSRRRSWAAGSDGSVGMADAGAQGGQTAGRRYKECGLVKLAHETLGPSIHEVLHSVRSHVRLVR
ncbi:hypothetical protein GCM10010389_15390 [Streptomyces echinoruber]|uniref:Uncharacterized protein n=1 Tax=Streptomyces echinoruber TaxID=68898 RepID=A0A918V9L3_9ACTN|nr:hypothetical protein GCM10010389_15390 [Streptomyces echinoruber]